MDPVPHTAVPPAPATVFGGREASSFIDDGESYERCWIEGKTDILALMRSLVTDRVLVSLTPGNGSDFTLSRMLAIDGPGNGWLVESALRPHENRQLTAAQYIQVDASHQRIRISFGVGPALAALYEGRPALRLSLPERILRLQRRNDYRAKMPVLEAARLRLPQETAPASPWYRIADISCGGLAMVVPAAPKPTYPPYPPYPLHAFCPPRPADPHRSAAADAGDLFIPGTRFASVQLEIPSLATLTVDLEIRHTSDYRDGMGRPMRRIGCRFLHLHAADAAVLQRYINLIDMDRRRHPRHW